ncbi:MAG TPA: enoyl-CoA hydratase/isomerase family protein [Myxococcota bacterium]|nr:enoyl-CoA hydratase/isomerase family protein [Myxococcota bacterium]
MREKLRQLGGGGKVRLDWTGPIASVVLDNPKARNALTPTMFAELGDAVDELEDSEGVGLVLRGAGDLAFCAGADLAFVQAARANPETAAAMCGYMHDLTRRLRALPLVSVAAIEGGAWGGGAELATATDLRVMSRTARVHFVHARLGLAPGWGGGVRLPQFVGRAGAISLLCASEPADGQRALEMGLVDRLAPPGGTVGAAESILAPMTAWSKDSVRACKRMVAASDQELDAAYAAAAQAFCDLW